ncbi:NB-ARC domain-containing protein [Micromonospora sp. NBC_01699]|uniref:AfsR/SARP family transcriptional regulator n=1 Tax=Micromonospora sp. NBC_01699 TaxID=2975984 RepID=UPI002E311F8F|nr:BTAD domain-containing putative transcriptional regulator [Micromonospora sp. NBC_01699]
MALAFHILGAVRVRHDGRLLRPPTGRPTALLATLLVQHNQMISAEALVDELWGARPPTSAVANLRSHVCQLRALLAPTDPAPRIVAEGGGYLLRVGADELDATEFERLAGAGHAALDRGEPAVAADLFDRALELWPAGPGTAPATGGPLVTAALDRLRERRVNAAEAYYACRLELWDGDLPGLIARLREHVAENPLRERPWSQLMTALYRVGDPVGAAETFGAARRVLAGDLGVAPGPELVDLHHAVLRRDPALLHPRQRRRRPTGDGTASGPRGVPGPPGPAPVPAAGGGRTPAPPVPHELPTAAPGFLGRRAELVRLRAALAPVDHHPRIATIYGMPGTGKSTLALQAAAGLLDLFPDGQIYLDLGGSTIDVAPLTPAQVLARLNRSLGATHDRPAGTEEEERGRIRSLLFERRILLVLDNATRPSQVADLLPVRGGAALLVTSRDRLSCLDGPHLRLGPLSAVNGIELLRRTAGPDRVDADSDATATVVDLCERLPLAVRTAGSRLAAHPHWSVAHLAARMNDDRHRLDEAGVRPRLAASYRSLGGARTAFRRLGLLRLGHVTPEVAAALLDTDTECGRAALDQLVEAQLAEPAGPGRFRIPKLLWLYAAELASSTEPTSREAAVRRVLLDYSATAARAARALGLPAARAADDPAPTRRPGPRLGLPAEAARWLRDERDNLICLARQAALSCETAVFAVQLLRVLDDYLRTDGLRSEATELSRVALAAPRLTGDRDRDRDRDRAAPAAAAPAAASTVVAAHRTGSGRPTPV